MSVLAVISFIASFFVGLAGIVCSQVALSQIRKTRERGRGFAIAGLIIGCIQMVVTSLWAFNIVVALVLGMVGGATTTSSIDEQTPTLPPVSSSAECAIAIEASSYLMNQLRPISILVSESPDDSELRSAELAVASAHSNFLIETRGFEDSDLAYMIESILSGLDRLDTDFTDHRTQAVKTDDLVWIEHDVDDITSALEEITSFCGQRGVD